MPLLLALALLVVSGGTLTSVSQPTDRADVETPQTEPNDFSTILRALIAPVPEVPWSESDRETYSRHREEAEEAAEKLRQMGINALPHLMDEVRALGRVEATRRSAALEPTRRLSRAFEILGTEAKPLLPMLIEELQSGRSIGPSMVGLIFIGGTEAGLALVPGLTNADPTIQSWTMSALSSFQTNREVALAASPLLIRHLSDDLAFSRAQAANTLGYLGPSAETVLPALLQVAKHDPDLVVRSQAIQAVGRFGTNAISAKPDLQEIVATEPEEHVRRVCSVALEAIEGKAAPDGVR